MPADGWPWLAGLASATPSLCMPQAETADRLAALWQLDGEELDRWRRIVAGTAIDTRYGVMPLEEVPALSTKARMEAYETNAPALARAAAGQALRGAGIEPAEVTDLVVVSCTGFSAPGLDVALVEDLGLRPTVRRVVVGFMGCFGAIIGLRTGAAMCCSDPDGVSLVLCLELCSLHLRSDRSPQNLVASALFADGAAAAVLVAPGMSVGEVGGRALGRVTLGRGRLLPQGRDWMSWRITDSGFAMTLSRDVPAALRRSVGSIVDEVCPYRPDCFVVHPGGAGILDAVDEGLGLGGRSGVEVSREILRRYGNMSSATLLFVLQEALRQGYQPPALLLAFGPGLSVESLLVQPAEPLSVGPIPQADRGRGVREADVSLRGTACGPTHLESKLPELRAPCAFRTMAAWPARAP
ncbi:MAG: type III polyketide synthase [Planctomycetota bacterium]